LNTAAAPGMGHARVLSIDPLIVMRFWHRRLPDELDVMLAMPASLKQVPCTMLLTPHWTLENPEEIEALRTLLDRAKTACPLMRHVIFCNTEKEQRNVQPLGVSSVFLNQNALADERIFKPLGRGPAEFDAVYNATFVEWKRQSLASDINSVALVGYMYHADQTASALRRLKLSLPRAVILNPVVDGKLQWLDPPAINKALNRAKVGLCLSAEEGAMYASIEYLLAGLPVVSTPSIGGRDVFFDPLYCRIVDATPASVRRAVEELAALNFPRSLIHEKTLEKLRPHRAKFTQLVQTLLDAGGAKRNFAAEWNSLHRHQWLDWVDLNAFWADIVRRRAA